MEYTNLDLNLQKWLPKAAITIGIAFAHDSIKEKIINKKPVIVIFRKRGLVMKSVELQLLRMLRIFLMQKNLLTLR
jgi:hypothetical protein